MPEKFDVIVVGAGPAGTTAALVLARAGLKVGLFERGQYPGSKNMFGGVLYYSPVLDNLIPNYWEAAPVERYITRRVLTFLSPGSSLSVDFKDSQFGHPPFNGFTLFRSKFDQWYAQKAVEAGALLVEGTTVEDFLWKDSQVIGVKVGRESGDVYCDVAIIADGAHSLLSEKAGLRKKHIPHDFAVSAKEVLALPAEAIRERFNLSGNEGVAQEFTGLPAGVNGGGFLYTNKETLSLGIVARLDSLVEKKVTVPDLLEDFKNHPYIRQLIKDAVLGEYSAHLLPESGLQMKTDFYGNGILVAGDAAGFLLSTGLVLEGMNFAIASGFSAAEAIMKAKEANDFSKNGLAHYKTLLEDSFVLQDLKTFRRAPTLLANPRIYEIYPSLACQVAERIFKSDGRPRKKFLKLIREEMKGKISTRQLLKDLFNVGGTLFWR